ncbi:ROK family protein [Lacrimispora sp.]|uniref:ROK family protein n=1 Tax=Lacrimispora sp. TaxID=2719234 RepID=UPI00345FE270
MKQSNAQTVLWTLCSCKTSTVKDLAQLTGLSYATVGNILNDFVDSGEVMLGEMLSATGGRPSQFYTFNAEHAHVLALSARTREGKHMIRACLGNLYGEVIWQAEQSFEDIQLMSFEHMIDSALYPYPTVSILSFSLPGVEQDGVIITNDYAMLRGVSFTKHFQEKYRLPVIIENDVNAAVSGYGKNAETDSVIVGIYFPKYFGPGAGIIIDGKVLKGACGFAGEVSLSPLGIDWLSMDYEKPREVGLAISRLISVFCGIINPEHVVLYGDFFTESVKETIREEISTETLRNVFPTIIYQDDLDFDIITGLITQAVSAYQLGLKGQNQRP